MAESNAIEVKLPTDTSELAESLIRQHGLSPVAWWDLTLNRTAQRLPTTDMALRGLSHPHVGFRWNPEDAAIEVWYPQGITGLRMGEAKKFLVTSWYGKKSHEGKGVRVSFVDVTSMDRIRYRHALLVQPSEEGSPYATFRPVKVHAGGIASIGNTIFVADTGEGVRAFRADMLFEAEADAGKNRCGIGADGKAYAFDYRYIMPQMAKYELDQNATKFSFTSIDYTSDQPPKLLTGNYHRNEDGYDNPPPTLAWWNLDGDRIVSRSKILREGLKNSTQGAVSFNGTLYLSCSGDNAHLFVGRDGHYRSHIWPHGCEDLHYSPSSGNLWCLTEHPGFRMVFAVRLTDYD